MTLHRSKGDGCSDDYLLIASGPQHLAPYLAGWQEFKDHIRKSVKEQPGWANVVPIQRKGEMQGWCRLKDRDDAERVYNSCIRSRGVVVHVFATSLRTGDFELIQCNCSSIFPGTGERGHSPRRSGIDVGGVNQAFGNRCAMTTSPYAMAMQPSYQYPPVYYQIPPYTPTAAYSYPVIHMQAAAAPMPTYSRNATGLRVNVGHGAVITEHRGIFIQGLDYKATSNEIKSLLYEVGLNPVEAKVHKDHSGKSKGVGTAKFGRKEDAERGVQMLNGKKHWGKTLKVRLDTESTVVGELKEPFIVDGTNRSASGL